SQLETGALLVRGKVPVSGGQFRDFHLQVLAASSLKGAPDAILFSQIPDLDLLGQMTQNQSASEVRIVFRAIGEMPTDRSMTPPEGPKNLSKSWLDLTKDGNNLEFINTRRAWVHLVSNNDDTTVLQAMNAAALDLARKVAGNPASVVVESQTN